MAFRSKSRGINQHRENLAFFKMLHTNIKFANRQQLNNSLSFNLRLSARDGNKNLLKNERRIMDRR